MLFTRQMASMSSRKPSLLGEEQLRHQRHSRGIRPVDPRLLRDARAARSYLVVVAVALDVIGCLRLG